MAALHDWADATDHPTVAIPLDKLRAHPAVACWCVAEEDPAQGGLVSPRQVMDSPNLYPDHARRIAHSDYTYPLLVADLAGTDTAVGPLVILDGVHRLARLAQDGAQTAQARRVPPDVLASAQIGQ